MLESQTEWIISSLDSKIYIRNTGGKLLKRACEIVNESEAKAYKVSLDTNNRIYIKCTDSADSWTFAVGIGWNDSKDMYGFEVSRAELVYSVFVGEWKPLVRDFIWLVRPKS